MARETICVVGASGFVGSHVAAACLARGHDVRATLREPSGAKADWLASRVAAAARGGARLTLVGADVHDSAALERAMAGTGGAIVCAGSPAVEPQTIDLMVAVGENCAEAALAAGIGSIVFTSSTGSTNPPEGEPPMKNEIAHWSDPDVQLAQGKFAAVGKTRLDRIVMGRMAAEPARLRAVIINPSMILGPAYSDEPAASHVRFAGIIRGERMANGAPNSSMSLSDVRDLAALHVNALEDPGARGRYFGVAASWHWRDILAGLERAAPGYRMPPADAAEAPVRPTQFDFTRRDSLGVRFRGLDAMLAAHVGELRRRAMI
jgi:nucleoside-diphosphate-sugar epimerase